MGRVSLATPTAAHSRPDTLARDGWLLAKQAAAVRMRGAARRRSFRSRAGSSAAASRRLLLGRRLGPPSALGLRWRPATPPQLESPAAAARLPPAPCPAKMAAVRRARSYCRCLVRFSDRELC